jgi:hypothetical protein
MTIQKKPTAIPEKSLAHHACFPLRLCLVVGFHPLLFHFGFDPELSLLIHL